MSNKAAILSTLVHLVAGHAVMQSPEPRKTGPSHRASCGDAVTNRLEADIAGPIENAMAWADADYNCDAYLCRGYQLEDNANNVLALSPGEVLDFQIELVAGHRPGWAASSPPFSPSYSFFARNLSAVDLATNTIIGTPLREWDDWLSRDPDVVKDFLEFNATVPDDLDSSCDEAGKCVLQWFWWAEGNQQTYESCVDFYIN